MAYAETKSTRNSLNNRSSPQYRAVEWLARDKVDNGNNWSGYELLQRYVLRVLYHSTNGEYWNNGASTAWFGGSSVCQWPASDYLSCNGQQVDYIDLWAVDLYGTIPHEIGLLTALRHVNVEVNYLTGTIPTQLGQLTALTYLSLYANILQGKIPTQLGRLTRLKDLVLSMNSLTGTIPTHLGRLTTLTNLYLSQNDLTGTIPLALTQLINLEDLWLFKNNLTGQVPLGFCEAPFTDWISNGEYGDIYRLYADCLSEVQCDCCDRCWDESGNSCVDYAGRSCPAW